MDPIEEQIQAQQQAIQNTPGFAGYQPSFSDVGIAPLEPLDMGNSLVAEPQELPNVKDLAVEAIKRQVAQKVLEKVGLNTAKATGISSLIGPNLFAPITAVSALTGNSLGISNFLRSKRAQKEAIRRNQSDTQGDVVTYPTGIMSMQPTAQDLRRGDQYGGSKSNRSAGFNQAERGGPQGR